MSDNQSNNKRIAKNTLFLSIRLIITMLISLYTTRVLLACLGVEDYGIYNVVCGFVTMFAFLNTSISNGIQRFYNFELGRNGVEGAKVVFNTALLIQLLLAIIILVLTESVGLWYMHNKIVVPDGRLVAAEWIFQFSVVSLVLTIFQAPYTAAVMAHEKMDFFAVVGIADAILKLLIVLVLPLLSGDSLVIYGFLFLLITVFDIAIYIYYCKKNFEEICICHLFNKDTFKSMLSFSGWNLFGTFSNMMKEQGINMILNLFFGPIVNAARGVAMQVNSALLGLVSNLTVAVRPQVVQSYAQGNIERTMRLTFSISKLTCMFLFLCSLPILLEIDYILRIWLGDIVPEHTNKFVIIIVAISFLNNLSGAISGVVHASGKMKLYQTSGSIVVLMSVPIAYVALSLGAPAEAALIISFIAMLMAVVIALFVLKTIVKYRIVDYIRSVIIPILLVFFISFWPAYFFHLSMEDGFVRFIVVGVISFLTTAIVILFVGFNKNERNLLRQMMYKKIKIINK